MLTLLCRSSPTFLVLLLRCRLTCVCWLFAGSLAFSRSAWLVCITSRIRPLSAAGMKPLDSVCDPESQAAQIRRGPETLWEFLHSQDCAAYFFSDYQRCLLYPAAASHPERNCSSLKMPHFCPLCWVRLQASGPTTCTMPPTQLPHHTQQKKPQFPLCRQ